MASFFLLATVLFASIEYFAKDDNMFVSNAQENEVTKEVILEAADEINPRHNDNYADNYNVAMIDEESDGKWGFIDKTGKIVVFPQYDAVEGFREGLAVVEKDGKRGFIDKTGREVIPLRYEWAQSFENGLSAIEKSGKWGFVDKTGKEVVSPHYDNVYYFGEGLIGVIVDDQTGFVDETGKEIVSPRYDLGLNSCEGYYIYQVREGFLCTRKDDKWGFVDKTGKEIVSPCYDFVYPFSEGFSIVLRNEKCGFIDKTGKEIVSPCYDDIQSFYEGFAAVQKNGKWGFIDQTGREIIPPSYEDAGRFSEGLATIKKDGKFGFIDKTGRVIVQPRYDAVGIFIDGLAVVYVNEKGGYVDKKGKEVVPPRYDAVEAFCEGLAAVQKNGKWGYVDKTGKEVVPPHYEDIPSGEDMDIDYIDISFKEGLAPIISDNKWGLIDKTGKEVVPPRYECVISYEQEGVSTIDIHFCEGMARVLKDGKYGYIDKTGTEVIPLRFAEVGDFSEGLAAVKVSLNDIRVYEQNEQRIRDVWISCNKQLRDDPYNTNKQQLESVPVMDYFLDPRFPTIADSIIADLKQITANIQKKCYNDLKNSQPDDFATIYLRTHPEAMSVFEHLKLECRCNNYSESQLVVWIADDTLPSCTCRDDSWNQYKSFFTTRSEFDEAYNLGEKALQGDVAFRQSLKKDIQEIADLLSALKSPRFKDGLTKKREDISQILLRVQYHKGKCYYDEVVGLMLAADAAMQKEWGKKGVFFKSRAEFFDAYVSGDYMNILKENKKKTSH